MVIKKTIYFDVNRFMISTWNNQYLQRGTIREKEAD